MMRNWAEFDIQGNIARIDTASSAVRVDIAANYSRKSRDSDEWENDAHFNRVTFFGKSGERVAHYGVGDLIHVRGRVRQNSYETTSRASSRRNTMPRGTTDQRHARWRLGLCC